jgi:hypothetical protein
MFHRWILTIVAVALFVPVCAVSMTDMEQEHQRILEQKRQLYSRIEQSIRQYPQSPDLAYMYYKLARLSADIDGVQNPLRTAQLYETVLTLDPEFNDKDVVLYKLAFSITTPAQAESESRNALYKKTRGCRRTGRTTCASCPTPRSGQGLQRLQHHLLEMPASLYNFRAVFAWQHLLRSGLRRAQSRTPVEVPSVTSTSGRRDGTRCRCTASSTAAGDLPPATTMRHCRLYRRAERHRRRRQPEPGVYFQTMPFKTSPSGWCKRSG